MHEPPMPRRQDGGFLADMFERADPETANFIARHNALLERVTVLERALESIAKGEMLGQSTWAGATLKAARIAQDALDG